MVFSLRQLFSSELHPGCIGPVRCGRQSQQELMFARPGIVHLLVGKPSGAQ